MPALSSAGEPGDENKALVAIEAELGEGGGLWRSAKLAVDVTGDSTRRNRSAKSVEILRFHGSDPAAQGSTEVEALVDFWRFGGDDKTLK